MVTMEGRIVDVLSTVIIQDALMNGKFELRAKEESSTTARTSRSIDLPEVCDSLPHHPTVYEQIRSIWLG